MIDDLDWEWDVSPPQTEPTVEEVYRDLMWDIKQNLQTKSYSWEVRTLLIKLYKRVALNIGADPTLPSRGVA